jgi:pyruvate kinase
MRSTKIVATVGPASREPEILRQLLAAGTNVFRINASHGAHDEYAAAIRTIRELAIEQGVDPAVMLDLQGPKIRLGTLEGGEAHLASGSRFAITVNPVVGDRTIASTTYPFFARDVKPGNRVLLADGKVELRALETDGSRVIFEVASGGTIRDQQGINLPGVSISSPSVTEKDRVDLEFGLANGIDLVALSFVRAAEDVRLLRGILDGYNRRIPMIAKIENSSALDNLEAILEDADGVMVARGDLGVEIALPKVPAAQKTIIERARRHGKFVITATQMLESMMENPEPTRAEVSDVANAILDGTDAVMLSGETAVGKFPVEAVRMMAAIAAEAEAFVKSRSVPDVHPAGTTHKEIVAQAAYQAGLSASVKAIVTFTASGEMPRLIARFRPLVPVFAFCADTALARALSAVYGVHTIPSVDISSLEDMIRICDQTLAGKGWLHPGESVTLVTGSPTGVPGGANLMKLHHVGDLNPPDK